MPARKLFDQSWWDDRSIPEPNTGCHLWTGGTDPDGYGVTARNGRSARATRVAYEEHVGSLGELWALHKCDNPTCVNPEHLYAGSSQQNCGDRVSRGRSNTARGEDAGTSKLTEAQAARALDLLHARMSQREIAALIGVSFGAVSCLKLGLTWKHLPRPWASPRHHRSGVDDATAERAIALLHEGRLTKAQIARATGMHKSAISGLANGTRWKHLPRPWLTEPCR